MKRAEKKTQGARAFRPSLDGTTGGPPNIVNLKERGHLARKSLQMRARCPRSLLHAKLTVLGGTPVPPASVDVCTCLPDAFSNAMHPARQRASVMIFAVLLLAAGVFVLAGIAQLAATQAVVGVNEWDALDRRVRLENSRAMARQYVLQHMFHSVITNSVTYHDASFGGFSLSPISLGAGDYWTTLSTTNTNVSMKINPFTLMERGGFYRVVIPGTISDGIADVPWNFQVRTRSPITAGYPVVQHKPASNDVSPLAGSAPYIDMNNAEQIMGFHNMARMRVSSVTNTNANDTNGYVGYLDVPIGVAAWGPFTNAQAAPYGAGPTNLQMVIDLGSDDPNDTNNVLVYDVPNTDTYIDTNSVPPTTNQLPVTAVTLVGTDIYGRKPLQVVVPATSTNVQRLILSGYNSSDLGRPVYFNCQRAAGSTNTLQVVTTNATGAWRIGITAAHCGVQFGGAITIFGGVRTDGTIAGSPTLRQEANPGGLDYIADRMMWLEDYKTP